MSTPRSWTWAVVTTAITVLLAGCATVDFDYPRTESRVPSDTETTYLGQRFAKVVKSRPPDHSGFLPLLDGIEALSARLLLARRAERTIDAQYYIVKTDSTSLAFIDALLSAADRGVRVRLLLDDITTAGHDAGMAALNSHPNFEIRVFNPLYRGAAGRAWSAITDFGRINRRMHTKSFTVDNQVTILGGRNIADEYFNARQDENFVDLDVVGIGSVVNGVSGMFDSFWNHETAVPIPAFARTPTDSTAALDSVREKLATSRADIKASRYARAVRQTMLEFVDTDDGGFEWAPYELVYDSPDKSDRSQAVPSRSITPHLLEALQSAESELTVLSPYFVPRERGIELFSSIRSRGVRVRIVTNSLAASDQVIVHGGYSPSRKPLLRSGVKLFEVRPDADIPGTEVSGAAAAKATLHTKAFLVDREKLFIGSFNFDPRSVDLNTESGVLVRSRRLADAYSRLIDARLAEQTFEVVLGDAGTLNWRALEGGREVIYEHEPLATWNQQLLSNISRLLPIRDQL